MKLIILIFTLTLVGLQASSAEYFVSLDGDDTNDGTSWEQAFQTIQKGVDSLVPGDTLTIGPGEYREHVFRERLGNTSEQTVIRAAIPGTVVLRGDVPAPAFQPTAGHRFVWEAPWDQPVQAVLEQDTLSVMEIATRLEDLTFKPGSCFYDEAAGKLYISTTDLQPPDQHHYTVSTVPEFGFLIMVAKNLVIDGLAATGFHTAQIKSDWPGYYTVWGILLAGAHKNVIRNCTSWLNGSGIAIQSVRGDGDEGGNLIESCTAFANFSRFSSESGNIMTYQSNNDVMRDLYVYLGGPNGIRHYGAGVRGPAILQDSLAWGSSYADIFLKGGQIQEYGLTERTVTLGVLHSHNIRQSIIGTKNQYNQRPDSDVVNLYYQFRGKEAEHYADPANFDFRLQVDSNLRQAGPDGTDRGVHPYQTDVLFVKPDGDDAASGLSMKQAWQTLPYAISQLRPGDTLYLAGGTYQAADLELAMLPGLTTSIRGRGTEPVIIRGAMRIEGSGNLSFERLIFEQPPLLRQLQNVRFHNCRFSGETMVVSTTRNLTMRHCEFALLGDQPALRVLASRDVELAGNIYDTSGQAVEVDPRSQLRYSDHNAYRQPPQGLPDRYSRIIEPAYELRDGVPVLLNRQAFQAGGPLGTWIGYYRENYERPLAITEPQIFAVHDRSATIEWWSGVAAEVVLAWGPTPACENKVTLNSEAFGTYSLVGLEPDTEYFVKLESAIEPMGGMLVPPRHEPADVSGEPIRFRTSAAAPVPTTYYVSPDGDDTNSGRSADQPWRTINHAAKTVGPGATVQIAGGSYTEQVRMRVSGQAGAPIIFTSAPGEQVILDGDKRRLSVAFQINGKHHITIDGVYFFGHGNGGWDGCVNIFDSSHISLTRSMMHGGRGVGGIAPQILRAQKSDHILMRNCIIASGFQGTYFTATTNLRIEHNVFLRNLICAILNSGGGPGDVQVHKNIFVDSIPSKVRAHLFELGGIEQYVFRDNCFYLRIPDEERKPFLFYGYGPKRISIAEYDVRYGDTRSVIDYPQFVITKDQTPTDRNGNTIDFLADWLVGQKLADFDDFFTLHPELQKRQIGLIPEAFADFHFHQDTTQEDAP